ncbi:MAG: FAD-binding oxidoreductase [Alphaproteobacteria bacterium]|nr:FAD-binding oxidoreductase [Alphaproteobacteria bacterium]
MSKRVIIVGAGILGASIAWHLAKAGAGVTVIEGGTPGGIATAASWAWINASWGNPEPYFRLRQRSMAEWRNLDREVPGLAVNWCGGLIWDLAPDELEAFARQQSAWGYKLRRVDHSAILAIEPNLRQVPDFAYHAPGEAMVEPVAAARALLDGAVAHGAQVLSETRVKWLIEEGDRVAGVHTDEGPLHADETIVAAGAATPELLASIGIVLKLKTPAGLLAHSRPARELLRGLVMTPGLHVRQTAEGRLVAGTDLAGADPLDQSDAMAADLMEKTRALIAGSEDLALDFHSVGFRPTPADGFPAIGRPGGRPGLYVAVSHSGMTLATIVGLFARDEILDGHRDPLLLPYAPDRAALVA